MPRQSRIDAPGALHHVICRGLERREIFVDDTDRELFLDRLGRVLTETSTSCFAWALIPNHFHLLVETGPVPISTIMRRLLTGYATTFNRRHGRHGHLFQNRYKSILCQRDAYLLELVRYIHLNPVRAGMVGDLASLAVFPYCGHGRLMGTIAEEWQETRSVLELFSKEIRGSRLRYEEFVRAGLDMGRRPDLTGGGLVRSSGGWSALTYLPSNDVRAKSDERILGDGDFVNAVLEDAREALERKYRLRSFGCNLDHVLQRVSKLLGVPESGITSPGKNGDRVRAKSLVAFWAVRRLGMDGVEVGRHLSLSQSAVSRAVRRGEEIARELGVELVAEEGNA